MKVHLEGVDGDIKTEWEKNYGNEKDNCAQDGTHCPQDGARYPQDGAKVYIANCIANYTAGSPPPRFIKRTDRNRY